ncbi:MAG: diguanylate cyclase [Lachnospiraceae bacterium]|nr:diguanylate cyclase [Lachnospiraceae bacterium]
MELNTIQQQLLLNAYQKGAILYALIDFLALSVLASMLLRIRTGLESHSVRKSFSILTNSVCALILLDMVCALMSKSALRVVVPLPVHSLLKSCFFIAAAVTGYSTFLAMEILLKTWLSKEKRLRIFSFSVCAIHIFLNATNNFHGLFFRYNEEEYYVYGPLYILEFTIPFFYILVSSIRAYFASLEDENYAELELYRRLTTVPILPIIYSIAQFLFDIPVLGIGLSLTILNLYLGVVQNSITSDPLTGLNNRRYLLQTIQKMMKSHDHEKTLFVMMMDLNYFKQINDLYGHTAGDQALIRFANILRNAVAELKKTTIARYGGDEFIICGELNTCEDVAMLRYTIEKLIEQDNAASSFPLSVSMGWENYNSAIHNVKQFIDLADQQLYFQKEKAHKEPSPYK